MPQQLSGRPSLPPHRPRPAGAPKVLDGIRVIDFTRVIAGPYCCQTLGDLGAEVIKIENPKGGDDTRGFPYAELNGESAPFLSLNRNKRSVALDMAVPAAREVARALIDTADVVVENFSTGVMDKFGLGYDAVAKTNPRLVYCSVSAYGRSGPFARHSGYDPITQAESGFMSMNGWPDQPPVRTGVPVIDMSTGMLATNAVLAALFARERLGKGQRVELALFDAAVTMTGFYGHNYLVSGQNQTRFGDAPGGSPSVGMFQASDGPFYVACGNDRLFRRLLTEVVERPDVAADPEFATTRDRVRNRVKLRGILDAAFATKPREHWVTKLKAANAPGGPLRTIEEAFNAPEVRERNLVSGIPHPKGDPAPNLASPLRFDLTPVVDPVAAPLLGQHTETVLREVLRYDEARLKALAAEGAFGAKR
ncbi:MAG: CoA transferase [Alphaproteobacteria bacterium]|nr:CoA transferase [Alphaproteobacteria bacterium]